MVEGQEKPRGILSTADREYLRGERELTKESERHARRRIRERVRTAVEDFSILWTHLPDEELEAIFQRDPKSEVEAIRSSFQNLIAFAILAMWANDDYYVTRIRAGIRQAAYARNRKASVQLNVDEELLPPTDDILRRLIDSDDNEVSIEEFDKALTDPDATPRLLAKVLLTFEDEDMELETAIQKIEAFQTERPDAPFAREKLPTIVSIERTFSDEDDDYSVG